ncbi:MAG: TetR family transcriptional regulator [Lachnospiraceae bacterium]
MKEDRQTRENLLKSAKKEFIEKGYNASSLRSICKNAGVTTGALYFFFQDKEDLFSTIIAEPLQHLYELISKHYVEEMEKIKSGDTHDSGLLLINEDMHMDLVIEVVDYLFQYKDEFNLLLTKAQGTKYENGLDEIIEITNAHTQKMADQICENMGREKIEPFTIHWIAHLQIDVFVQVLLHGISKKEAENHLRTAISFLVRGWQGMF